MNNQTNSRQKRPSIGQAFGATAGLITTTALRGSELVDKSFDVAGNTVQVFAVATDIAVDAVNLAQSGFKLSGESWLENLQTENKVDKAYAEIELIKAEIEVDELMAEAEALRKSRTTATPASAE